MLTIDYNNSVWDRFCRPTRGFPESPSHNLLSGALAGGVIFMSETKVCTKCGKEFPATSEYFRRNSKCKDGLGSQCKQCQKEYNKKYNIENKEKKNAHNREYRANNKEFVKERWYANAEKYKERQRQYAIENAEKLKEKSKQFRDKHKEELKLKSKKYYEEHKQERIEYYKGYCERNPEKARIWALHKAKRRQARKRNLPATLTEQDWLDALEYFDNSCAYCGCDNERLFQEHVIPLSKDGYYTRSNIIPGCRKCNNNKTNYDMETWYRRQPFFSELRLKKIYKYTGLKPGSKIQQMSMF